MMDIFRTRCRPKLLITPERAADQVSRRANVTGGQWLAVAAMLCAAAATAQEAGYRGELRLAVEAVNYGEQDSVVARELTAAGYVTEFYERRGFHPAWRDEGKVEQLIVAIRGAYAHGLSPEDYHLKRIEAVLGEGSEALSASSARWAAFELVLTDALVSLVHHLRYGKTDPQSHEPSSNFRDTDHAHETLPIAEEAIAAPALDAFLEQRFSRNDYYRRLQATLADYRRIADDGGWPLVDSGASLRRGMDDPRVPALARRLAVTGDLGEWDFDAESTGRTVMDERLEAAVRRFQSRHTLDADGIVGAATLGALNVPVGIRIQQLRLTLERIRWILDEGLGDSLIAVNIAGFRAYVVSGGRIAWETRVVVGRDRQQTPIFRDQVRYVVFNPTWTVPYTIATRELLPQLKADPDWFAKRNFELRHRTGGIVDPATVDWQAVSPRNFPYTLIQRPGPDNALGQVKFVFPNEHAVYLHDTPARQLFGAAERAFSHGCIRVEHPLELAEILLQPQGWDRRRINAAVASGKGTTVYLDKPLPVLLLYLTANVDPNGTVHFYRDVYNRDTRVAEALDGAWRIE